MTTGFLDKITGAGETLLDKITGAGEALNEGVKQVSHAATHVNLIKEKKRLGYYYAEISEHPVNNLQFEHIYLAKHKLSQEYRCIKVMNKKNMPEEFFWKEVETYRTLYHPNVLHLYETFEDDHSFYFVAGRLDRPNIFQAIPRIFKKASDFDEVQVALVIRTILKTLMFCHSKGFAHTGLSYEYILLDPSKGLRSLYIAGFGRARWRREYRLYHHTTYNTSNEQSIRSHSSDIDDSKDDYDGESVHRTDLFAAPETRLGDLSTFEGPADLWSTAVLAYQLLARRNPFEDEDVFPINYKDAKWKADHFKNDPYLKHLSKQAKDFLMHLMCYEPEDRPTAEQALRDPWFNICENAGRRVKKKALNNCLTNLQNFHANNKLEQATRMYIVHNLLHAEERAQLDACFRYLDKQRNNVITRDELGTALTMAKPKDKVVRIESMLEDIFDRIDVQKTGVIDYSEFLAAAADDSVVLTRENLKATFDTFDKSHTGAITAKDLKRLFNEGKETKVLRRKDAQKLITRVDKNGDGEIDFEEFCELMHADLDEL